MSTQAPLLVERLTGDRAGVVVLTLNVPDRRNAMTAELTGAWQAAIGELSGDTDVRAVVVTGAGSAFCSGGDVGWIGADPNASVAALRARMMPFYRAWLAIRDLEVPTVAAVNGAAIGAGLCLALACDLRYAVPEAKFSAPFTALGMHAGMAATWLLPEAVGLPAARELLFTGRVVVGQEAADIGLVNRVLPAEQFVDAVLDIAAGVARTAPIAARLTKVALARGGHASFDAALQWEGLAQPITLATADLQEGLAAAKERRPPRFSGS
ncbi:MAG: enoyl-CoA hydratase/isomerase family protein [Actinomycetes bacterium]